MRAKLDGAQEDLDAIVADFRKVVALRHTLQAADVSLKTASDTVADMATTLKGDALALEQCVSSLKTAADVIGSIDPKEMRETYTRIEGRIVRLEESSALIEKRVKDTANLERIILGLMLLLLVVFSLNIAFSFRSNAVTGYDSVPQPTLALRGSIPEDGPAVIPGSVPNYEPGYETSPRFVALCSPPDFSENASCRIDVSSARRGYGYRSKSESI